MSFYIEERFDGRLPEYHVCLSNVTVKVFDTREEAEKWIEDQK